MSEEETIARAVSLAARVKHPAPRKTTATPVSRVQGLALDRLSFKVTDTYLKYREPGSEKHMVIKKSNGQLIQAVRKERLQTGRVPRRLQFVLFG